MKTSLLLLPVVLLTACGSADDADTFEDSGTTAANCTPRTVSWLHEGNFWRVAWSDVAASPRRADVGTYAMQLGKSYVSGDYTLYPLVLSGNYEGAAPRYKAIGSNRCGDIVGVNGSSVTTIFNAGKQTWSGNGFWGQVAASKGERVNETVRSIIMDPSTYLKPPFTAVGATMHSSTSGSEGGCKLYYEVGQTICTEGDSGTTTDIATVEYWSDTMGPVVFQDSADYDGDSRSREKRIEVFYFANNATSAMQTHVGTNAIADAFPLVFNKELSTHVVVLPENGAGKATAAGRGIPASAVGIENWFSLDVTPTMARKSLLVFLSWTNDADYELLVFTAPDSEYGFSYVTSGDALTAADIAESGVDISGGVSCSGQYAATKYLVGVRRLKHGTGDDGYALVTQAD